MLILWSRHETNLLLADKDVGYWFRFAFSHPHWSNTHPVIPVYPIIMILPAGTTLVTSSNDENASQNSTSYSSKLVEQNAVPPHHQILHLKASVTPPMEPYNTKPAALPCMATRASTHGSQTQAHLQAAPTETTTSPNLQANTNPPAPLDQTQPPS